MWRNKAVITKMLLAKLHLKCTPNTTCYWTPGKQDPWGAHTGWENPRACWHSSRDWLVPWASLSWALWLSCSLGTEYRGSCSHLHAHCFPDILRKRVLILWLWAGNGFSLSLLTDITPGIFNGNIHSPPYPPGLEGQPTCLRVWVTSRITTSSCRK